MTPDEIKVGASYELKGRCCDIRVLQREEVAGGYIRFRVEKISGRNPGVRRWEFADYLRFAIARELTGHSQRCAECTCEDGKCNWIADQATPEQTGDAG